MADSDGIKLTDQIKGFIKGAYDSGNVLLIAAVDAANKPVLSYRGSVSVYSDDQLSFWVRNKEGGTIEAIKQNPNVALMYRSPTTPLLKFEGRARVATSEEERNRAFTNAHEREQAADEARAGNAVIVDLDSVSGVLERTDKGPVFCRMVRA